MGYIQRVVHYPSIRQSFVNDVYRQIGGHKTIQPGYLDLLLRIIGTATHVWSDIDVGGLFSSPAEAHSQTAQWFNAAYDVLYAGMSSPNLETIQGVIILSFLLCNLKGVSLRYRSLLSTGLLLGRELGLHRIDHNSDAGSANTLQAEMGLRVWLMAARHGGRGIYQVNPRHMMVNKPHNINDADLHEDSLHRDLPVSQLTEMSYFLQRVRMAEISRMIVDHDSVAVTDADWQSGYITAMDIELVHILTYIPPFFHLDRYKQGPNSTTSGVFIQAYMLSSLLHTARCKLHLRHFISGQKKENPPFYASSRVACVQAAREIVRGENQLNNSQHPFVLIRMRLSAILYGVFVASIVLLVDASVNGTGSPRTRSIMARWPRHCDYLRMQEATR
ncbi:hypothetical protein VPNG_02181 [Cytospora leucostoma]|uniref:Transcription factor domain-containing protein n=1 Tax=Cytospora leucostoma TaxID=1230097 RepID=A0A423XHM1_9PEZI|nr:hypothetical protein VPNG_02181 [Cytospora leucostoma]